jgi:hypothetical protein
MAQIPQGNEIYKYYTVTPAGTPKDLLQIGKYIWVLTDSNVCVYSYYDYDNLYDITESEYDWTARDELNPYDYVTKIKLIKNVIPTTADHTFATNVAYLEGEQTIGGTAVVSKDVVSLTGQTDSTQNGLYVVTQLSDAISSGSATVYSNFNLASLSGEQDINGVNIVTGNIVNAQHQTITGNNGLYYASTSAWIKISPTTPIIYYDVNQATLSGEITLGGINVVAGNLVTVSGQTITGDNGTYVVQTGAWNKLTSTTPASVTFNVTPLSGEKTASGTTLSVGVIVNANAQTTSSQNGQYVVQSAAWTLVDPFLNDYYKSTTNISSLSGLPSITYLHVKNYPSGNTATSYTQVVTQGYIIVVGFQTDPTQNGTYVIVSSGAWVKIDPTATIPEPTWYFGITGNSLTTSYTKSGAQTIGGVSCPVGSLVKLSYGAIGNNVQMWNRAFDNWQFTNFIGIFLVCSGAWIKVQSNILNNIPPATNMTLSGTGAFAGTLLSAGSKFNLSRQSNTSENGVYTFVANGNCTQFSSSNDGAYPYVDEYLDTINLSANPKYNVNGTTVKINYRYANVGNIVKIANQTITANNGNYLAQSGAWLKLGSLTPVVLTSNVTLSGTSSFGAYSYLANTIATLTNQTTTSENGSYLVSTGAWTKLTSLTPVVTSIINITLSGLQNIDGTPVITGNVVSLTNQTNTSENGLYIVKSGAWIKIPSLTPTISPTVNVALIGEQTIYAVPVHAGDVVHVANQTNLTEDGYYIVSAGAWTKLNTRGWIKLTPPFINFTTDGHKVYLNRGTSVIDIDVDSMEITSTSSLVTLDSGFTYTSAIYADGYLWRIKKNTSTKFDTVQSMDLTNTRTWVDYYNFPIRQVATRKFCSGKNGYLYISSWNTAEVVKLSTSDPLDYASTRFDFTPDLIKFDEKFNKILVHTGTDKIVAIDRGTGVVTNLYYTTCPVIDISTLSSDGAHWIVRSDKVVHKIKPDGTTMLRTKEPIKMSIPVVGGVAKLSIPVLGLDVAGGGSATTDVVIPITNTRLNNALGFISQDLPNQVITMDEVTYSFTLNDIELANIIKTDNCTTQLLLTPEYNIINHNDGHPLLINEYIVCISGASVWFARNKNNYYRTSTMNITGQAMVYSGTDFYTGEA